VPYSALPEPMLARSARLPTSGHFAFEVKWDGFRAIVSTEGSLRVRTRRGWNMTEHVQFLAQLPVRAVLDGELVAFDSDGRPDFPLVCDAVLHRQSAIPLVFVAFDVLRVEGRSVMRDPYSERRRILEQMQLAGPRWHTPEAFEDGAALWDAVCEHELEGVVAKRRLSRYTPGEPGWVKTKNRDYWRWELEREGALRGRSRCVSTAVTLQAGLQSRAGRAASKTGPLV
jgi:bifunctional non-homologous end joining protein LigD